MLRAWKATSLSGLNGITWPPATVTVAGTELAPSGPEATACAAASSAGRCAAGACAAAALNAASAPRRLALPAKVLETCPAALLSATAPMIAGPRPNPRSRSILVVPLAMPARWLGMVLTATAVTEATARANPIPAITSGAAIAASDKFVAGTAASHRSPPPMRANPKPSTHLGLYRSSSL